jgi:hypothetical protein
MKGDFTRSTFRQANHYNSVRFKQGSVILDAEINEEIDILAHTERTTNGDVIGLCGAPYHDPKAFRNFAVSVQPVAADLLIAPGRIYVDGILCENDISAGVSFTKQKDFPNAKLPTAGGNYVVFLDVWERFVSPVDQFGDSFPPLRETALAGPDTASRSRVVWQVKMAAIDGTTCDKWTKPVQPTGRMRAQAEPAQAPANDCLVPIGGGYRRLENQLYRVEIHKGNQFKFSRDNGSQASKVKATDQVASVITVEDSGRDEILGFASAKFVELSDEERVLDGQPGLLLEVDTVSGSTVRVKNPTNASLASGANPVLRRWDGVGNVTPNTLTPLEDGVQVEFDGGTFAPGDYWMIPARTLTGRVEWPANGTLFESRHGTIHHYCPLAVVSFNGSLFKGTPTDCRRLFPPLTAIKASDVSYDPAQCANLEDTTTVQEALDKLCQSTGGEEPGIHIKGVTMIAGGFPVQNDMFLSAREFASGLRISCDEKPFQGSVMSDRGLPNPVCYVTLDIPWPLNPPERDLWGVSGTGFVGFNPTIVAAHVTCESTEISWLPLPESSRFLLERLLPVVTTRTQGALTRVLAHLTLKGNFIFSGEDTRRRYLDGDSFGRPVDKRTHINFPSGNGRRGGDFEMWFWLSVETVRVPPFGLITRKGSRFFTTPSGARAINLAIDRRSITISPDLLEDYIVDTTQVFDRDEATRLARDINVPNLTMLSGVRLARITRDLGQMIERNTHVNITFQTVPDENVPETVRNAMAAGNPPDMVFGDEALSARLVTIGYTSGGLIRL